MIRSKRKINKLRGSRYKGGGSNKKLIGEVNKVYIEKAVDSKKQ